jgi:hypothetical protein
MSVKNPLSALLISVALFAHPQTPEPTEPKTQTLDKPGTDGSIPGRVAINGNSAIVIEYGEGSGRLARPYELASNGQWQAGAPLFTAASAKDASQDDVAIGNGFAAVHIGDQLRIFQRSGNLWVPAPTANPIPAAHGLAISGGRILVARPGCNYDADLYQKSSTTGKWIVTGRIRGATGPCDDHGALLDIDGDVALVTNESTHEIREYRRNGSVTWPQVATITPPAGTDFDSAAPTLKGDIAFVSTGDYFKRSGSGWAYQGRVRPINSALTDIEDADYRGSLLLSFSTVGNHPTYFERHPYLYQPNSSGGFDQVAELDFSGIGAYADVSGNHAVVSAAFYNNENFIEFFELPAPLRAPPAIANDFEAHDVSGWQQTPGSQFALASSGGTVYRQASTTGTSTAFLTDSDWSYSESIEADIKPTAFDGADRWVGLAVRYVDADNQYYVTLRSSNKLQLKRNVGGAFKTLAEATLPVTLNQKYRVKLGINGSRLVVWVNDSFVIAADDTALTHGRAALMTYRARADFDNVFAAPTSSYTLASMDFSDPNGSGKPFTTEGGKWELVEQDNYPDVAFGQTSTEGNARAWIGTPTGDQVVHTKAKLASYASSSQGAWFGLLARWVDARTHYYLSVRSTGQLQIRRVLNGSVTVLKSVPFTATPGHYYDFDFSVIGNELHAYVDGVFVAGAIDNAIPQGQYGLGTYRAAATFQFFGAEQP